MKIEHVSTGRAFKSEYPIALRRAGRLSAAAVLALLGAAASSPAHAEDKSGVQPTHVVLPKGPGSLGGVGENAEVNASMGLMTYGVDIEVPSGYSGLTPKVRVSYSSGGGNTEVGIGWSLGVPTIERMTARILPGYTPGDTFVVNGSEELVRVGASTTYRSRFESSFVKYTWVDAIGNGLRGYWKAEYPDGTVGYFGARAPKVPGGPAVMTDASVAKGTGTKGAFRYYLTETVDPQNHHVTYDYTKDGAVPLLARIAYVYEDTTPRYTVNFTYESRPDLISDAKPGFPLLMSQRLTGVTVNVKGAVLRRYALQYEDTSTSGGLSRLSMVSHYGEVNPLAYPVKLTFGYSGGLGASCTGASCTPYVVSMTGDLGFDLRSGTADLLDLNGDSLPDVVSTTSEHGQIYMNKRAADSHGFGSATSSQQYTSDLALPGVQLADMDGDGFADMYDAQSNTVLWNKGKGDFESSEQLPSGTSPPFAGAMGQNLRFFDYNNDKKIDVIYSSGAITQYYVNQGRGQFTLVAGPSVGMGFTDGHLQLADINGDNLTDAVQVTSGGVQYRVNYGFGTWAPWKQMVNAPIGFENATLHDVNGDGLSDLVLVMATSVSYALNQNAQSFAAPVTLLSSPTLALPSTFGTTLRFADMNGNGSTDIVWFDGGGHATYLELFPTRPNLLTRIGNSIGKNIEVLYGSSVAHMIRDGGAESWTYRLPHAFLTVDEVTTWDSLSNVREKEQYHYRDGYYDSSERLFRGFTKIEETVPGDASVEEGNHHLEYEVGQNLDVYRRGLLLREEQSSGGRALWKAEYNYGDCAVGGVSGSTDYPIRFICKQSSTRTVMEGQSSDQWVTTSESESYDAYGNIVEARKDGVTSLGGGGCGPCEPGAGACGSTCSGDEQVEKTTYVSPDSTGGRWMLHKPATKKVYGPSGSVYSEQQYYYDGAPFVGLAGGTLSKGLLTRTSSRVSDGVYVDTDRRRYDGNGAVVETLDANGHGRTIGYDADSLLPVSETAHFADAGHAPYDLQVTVTYDPVLETVVSSTSWTRLVGGQATSPVVTTQYGYDAFGRLTAIARPGDTLSAPTETYSYYMTDPYNQIVHQTRSKSGGAQDLQETQCFDGMGRLYQKRVKLGSAVVQVDGFTQFNVAGSKGTQFEPYAGGNLGCDAVPSSGTLSKQITYDALGRVLSTVEPDSVENGTSSVKSTVYLPLKTIAYDEEDFPGGRFPNTPVVRRMDGLGRLVALERYATPGATLRTTFGYDELGRLASIVDPKRNVKSQTFDLLGRVVSVSDPDTGVGVLTYDAAGNKVSSLDARGVTVRYAYDEGNRLVATWNDADPSGTRLDYVYDASVECPSTKCTMTAGTLAEVHYPVEGGRASDWSGYDARGNATYFGRNIDGQTFEVGTTFDNAGRAVAKTYPNGRVVTIALDGAGRIAALPGLVPQIDYDARGLRKRVMFASGVQSSYAYDSRMRTAAITTTTPSGTLVQSYQYGYDRVGNVLSVVDNAAPAGAASENATYTYDAMYRMLTASLDVGRPGFEETQTYGYDAIDNMILKSSSLGASSPDHVGSMTYGESAGPHAVTTAGDKHYVYDAAGNLVTRDDMDITWDYRGRMTGAGRAGVPLASFTYSADVARVKKVEGAHTTYYVTDDYEVRDGVPTIYVHLGADRVARIHGASSVSAPPSAAMALGLGRDLALKALAASAQALSGAAATAETVTYLHRNHLGSITATTDASGAVVKQTATYPFGLPRVANQSEADYAFTGMERDDATGLVDFGPRYLDSWTGNWASADPSYGVISEADRGLSNRFGYASHNPMSRIDPDGFEDEPVPPQTPSLDSMLGDVKPTSREEMLSLAGVDTAHDIFFPGDTVEYRLGPAGTPQYTEKAAAFVALSRIYTKSYFANREWAGLIYQTTDGRYSFTPSARGYRANSWPDNTADHVPRGAKVVADYHSHGGSDPHDYAEVFSHAGNLRPGETGDREACQSEQRNSYMVTPTFRFGVLYPLLPGAKAGHGAYGATYLTAASNKDAWP
jgi:RHS repeat-associated protein